MNRLMIIGNLTKDPESAVVNTSNGAVTVTKFTVAVTKRGKGEEDKADFFRVNAWRQLGENCKKYLSKGRKVAVVGAVSVETYTTKENEFRASMQINADEVEFLTPRGDADDAEYTKPASSTEPAPTAQASTAFTQV